VSVPGGTEGIVLSHCGVSGRLRVLALGLAFLGALPSLHAQAEKRPLRWGGDATGGAPYIIEKPDGSVTGFEVELADYLGEKLGRKPKFVNGSWSQLPDLLGRGDIDIVLNGYEWSADLEKRFASTIPYYNYKLQLIGRKGDTSIKSWDDLRGKSVGVLKGSAADRYLAKRFGRDIDLRPYDTGVTDVMALVSEQHELQATLQDLPAALYYLPKFPKLEALLAPVDPGYYVIYVRRDDPELLRQLNEALRQGIRGGEKGRLGQIYSRYGLWNEDQLKLVDTALGPWPPTTDDDVPGGRPSGTTAALSIWERLPDSFWTLLEAAGMTVLLSCLSMPLAILLGLAIAVARLYGPRWLTWLPVSYVEFLRGTPLMLQIYFIYFVLAGIIRIDAIPAAILALAVNYSAYEAENYRAGLLAIPRGQMEAALALGMTKWTALWRIIIPQAVRLVIPPVTNDFIALFKDTSVCSVIAVNELTGRYYRLYNNNTDMLLELALLTSILYLLMSIPLSLLARRLERQFPKVIV
jgi:polar amino acid transport system substrate-binding protein